MSQQESRTSTPAKAEPVKELETEFGQNVRKHREQWEWSQREFASRLTKFGMSVDASAVSRLEKGTRAVRLGEASIIADVLQIELDELLTGDESPLRLFKSARNFANRSMNEARTSLSDAVSSFLEVAALLDEHPEFSNRLVDDYLESPRNGDEYLEWVMKRTERLAETWWDHIEEPDQERASKAQALLNLIAGDMIGPDAPEPSWKKRAAVDADEEGDVNDDDDKT